MVSRVRLRPLACSVVVLLPAFAGCSEADTAALKVLEYDEGYVRFIDAAAEPRRELVLRGEMIVKLYESYVTVLLDDNEIEYVIPREQLVYAGVEIK